MDRSRQDILTIDIGGTGLKAAVVDPDGRMKSERVRVPTPHPCPPGMLVDTLVKLVATLPPYGRIAVAFPGVVRDGRVLTAPNLSENGWDEFPLTQHLTDRLGGRPARMINDAELQGLGVIAGKGLELVLTLGTGAGTALFRDGMLMPHMELAHHPVYKSKTYDEYVGNAAREKVGNKRWSKRIRKVTELLYVLFHYDRLIIGGGNARHIRFEPPANVTFSTEDTAFEGGAALWRMHGLNGHGPLVQMGAPLHRNGGTDQSQPRPAA